MIIKTDENGYLEACSMGNGNVEGVEYAGAIPEGFYENMTAYRLKDGELILDEAKRALISEE